MTSATCTGDLVFERLHRVKNINHPRSYPFAPPRPPGDVKSLPCDQFRRTKPTIDQVIHTS